MTSATAERSLLAGPPKKKTPDAPKLVRVAREHGVNPFTQFGQILLLQIKRAGLHASEYYDFELYHARYDAVARTQFLGALGSRRLNLRLSPRALHKHFDLMDDKALFSVLLAGLGLQTTQTQAVVDVSRTFGRLPVLRDVASIRRFLTQEARYPLFAKPAFGSLSVGSALIEEVTPDGETLRLGNGRTVALQAFAQEILKFHGQSGFLLQSAVRQHPALTDIAGPALGTIRVVTVTEEAGRPRVLYVLWKIPSPDAMSDNFWQSGSMLGNVDLETGEVLGCRQGTGLETTQVENHPVSGKPVTGTRLPFWSEVKALAEQAHAVFPNAGVMGWDVGLSEDGPVIVEGNTFPHHTLYQLATGEGILNPHFGPVFDRIATRQAAAVKQEKAARRAKRKR